MNDERVFMRSESRTSVLYCVSISGFSQLIQRKFLDDKEQHINRQDELYPDGASQPGAGAGQHLQPADPAGVPGVPGPHHSSHQAVHQGPPGVQ